jgi:hypothetical protein
MIDRRAFLIGSGSALALAATAWGTSPRSNYDDPDDVYAAFADHASTLLDVEGGRITLVFADGAAGLDRDRVTRWARLCGRAMATYFGRFPVSDYRLLVIAQSGAQVGHATTFGYRGPVTRIHVGTDATDDIFLQDWVLVHEMAHAALPDLPRRALWLQEGNATWIEPIARAQAGQLPVSEVWRQAIEGMPKGLRTADAGGMDGTREWGRLYWGGARFWLEAEIAIYEQSQGRFLLRDALRAINRESAGNGVEWEPERMMAAGDRATDGSALSRLYKRFADEGDHGRLDALFHRLGVSIARGGGVMFDRRAELADLAHRITMA